MNNFDFSIYDFLDFTPSPVEKKTSKKKENASSFDFSIYDPTTQKKPLPENADNSELNSHRMLKQFQIEEKTSEELSKMSISEKMQYVRDLKTQREFLQSAGFTKGALSGATLGATKHIPGLESKEHELHTGFGELVGLSAPYGAAFKAISYPIKAIANLAGFGKFAKSLLGTGGAVTVGAGTEAAKEAIAGEELDPTKILLEGTLLGSLDLFIKGSISFGRWIKSLTPAQQSDVLIKGVIPPDLPTNSYKFFENEVVPELQLIAEKEFTEASQKNIEQVQLKYQQELENTKALHEQNLIEMEKQNRLDLEEYAKAQDEYQNKIKQIAAEHENQVKNIEEENQRAIEEYQTELENYQKQKSIQEAEVSQPIEILETQKIEGTGQRMAPSDMTDPSLQNRVGNKISNTEIINSSEAGQDIANNVRQIDEQLYTEVNEAYKISREANQEISTIHPQLVQKLHNFVKELMKIPHPSTVQKQAINAANTILEATATISSEEQIVGLKEINNQTLIDQIQSLRQIIDFDFSHGDAKNIFKPIINAIQDSVEAAAKYSKSPGALEKFQNARNLYREWATLFDSDYIRPIRNLSNKDFSKMFRNVLDFDEFRVLQNVLEHTPEGIQLSNSLKRSLIEKNLDKFMKNPRMIDTKEFNKALRELRTIISPQEEESIREVFNQARKEVPKESIKVKEPVKPKLKEAPEEVKVPLFTKKPPVKKEITQVKIPAKKAEKPSPEMIAASKKMNITPEKAMSMTDTPTGIKNLKNELNKTETGKKIFNKLAKDKVKNILFEGKVQHKFTGGELYRIINKGDNYAVLSEILGEATAEELLNASSQIGEKRTTVDALKKYGMKLTSIKALILFGIL